MVTRYERDDEVVPLALKRLARGVANANRATGTEIRQTADKVEGMSADVTEALEQAQQAIEDAADALTTSNGKNSRRRGQTEPAPPPGGWVQGDQWIVDNDEGTPIEVRVWDGTEFVFEQLLAAELLVVSGGGVIRLADGTVTADSIAADAIDGMIITGATIRTAASGARVQLDSVGLRAFNSSDEETARLTTDDLGMQVSGPQGHVILSGQLGSSVFAETDLDRYTEQLYGNVSAATNTSFDGQPNPYMQASTLSARVGPEYDPISVAISVYRRQNGPDKGAGIFSNGAPLVLGSRSQSGERIPIEFDGDRDWKTVTHVSNFITDTTNGVVMQWRVRYGFLQIRGRIKRSSNAIVGASYTYITAPDAELAGVAASVIGDVVSTPGSATNMNGLLRIMGNGQIQAASQEVPLFPNVLFLL